MRIHKRRSLVAVAVAVLMTGINPAAAHDADFFYTSGYWATNVVGQTVVSWRFHRDSPPAVMLDPIRRGTTPWNNEAQNFVFAEAPRSTQAAFPARTTCDHVGEVNGVQMAYIDGVNNNPNTLASTWGCGITVGGARFYGHFEMEYDSSETWYNSLTGDPPSNTTDTQAVSTHEFGHATGWRLHWDFQLGANGSLCENAGLQKHTMCATYDGGTVRQRTLEEHDKHTFHDAY